MKLHEYTQQNRRAWNEIAAQRQQALFPPAEFFADGGSTLAPAVLAAVGPVQGQQLLHLQCATGEDSLAWANAGATVTGVDISNVQIELAQRKAAAADIDAQFVAADVYALPAELQSGTFDIVYSGDGVLVWLPDLNLWAQAISAALRPGGRFILYEEHPIAGCLWVTDGNLHIDYDYFARNQPDYSITWSHFPGGEFATETKVEFQWPLGDVITAIAQAGLRIERLEEYPSTADWRFGEQLAELQQFPGQFLLLATK